MRWIVAAVVLAANTMDLLDATIVNVAGPSIHRELGGGASTIQWLSAAYTLAFAVLLIAGARLGDIFGRRRMFLLGLAGFTVFSAACAISQDIGMLIAFRALQGGFGALMIPQGFGLLKEVFDDEELGRATRLFGPSTGLAMLGAPILAGALIDADLWSTGWRLVFLINVPIGLIAFRVRDPVAAERGQSPRPQARRRRRLARRPGARGDHRYPLHPGPGRWLASLDVRHSSQLARYCSTSLCATSDGRSHNALIEPSLLANGVDIDVQ